MLVKIKRGWEMPESQATPEPIYRDRRRFLMRMAALPVAASVGGALLPRLARAAEGAAGRHSAPRNPAFALDRPVTEPRYAYTYTNFYEYGGTKDSWEDAEKNLKPRPWPVRIDGMVEKEMTLDVDDLLARMELEERLYRHRCVEAWAMAVPWMGFPLRKLVEMARPLSSAKYVEFQTFRDTDMAPRQLLFWFPWPYVEGLSIEEATNDLAFLATGLYGQPLKSGNGAPLRLVTPWKYGFKSAKSLVRITFTDQQPQTFWARMVPNEYGFWANVNPKVPHPRWSQETERMLGTDERLPTQLYNGYGEHVAHLYDGADRRYFF